MASIFEKGEAMQAAAFGYAAVSISYYRNGGAIAADIPAKLGRTLFRAENQFGVTVRTEQRDFIIRAADLDITPEVGDEIRYDGKTYSVSAPNGEPCWKWHTRTSHSQMRIHAKFNGEISDEQPTGNSDNGNSGNDN